MILSFFHNFKYLIHIPLAFIGFLFYAAPFPQELFHAIQACQIFHKNIFLLLGSICLLLFPAPALLTAPCNSCRISLLLDISFTMNNTQETVTFEEIREFEQLSDETQEPLPDESESGSCNIEFGSPDLSTSPKITTIFKVINNVLVFR